MLRTEKVLQLRGQQGRSVRVVREHYLRPDVPCRSALCRAGCPRGEGAGGGRLRVLVGVGGEAAGYGLENMQGEQRTVCRRAVVPQLMQAGAGAVGSVRPCQARCRARRPDENQRDWAQGGSERCGGGEKRNKAGWERGAGTVAAGGWS